ncbi:MAG: dihydropteroate synthase [bacterium JZ-2024 1]
MIPPLTIGSRTFTFEPGAFHIMAVLNVTPDSFYVGSRVPDTASALSRGLQAIEEGADLLDIGGESTRPGSDPVPADEELARVIPVISALRAKSDIPISIDTVKSEVAREALSAGANLVNDISGLQMDPQMPYLLVQSRAPVVIQHIKGTPKTMQQNPEYSNLIGEISDFFQRQISLMTSLGYPCDLIILDPGIGFGKKYEHNLTLLKNIHAFRQFRRPVLVGPSRKSFIGHYLGGLPPDQRLEGTLVSLVFAYLSGAHFFRVHDVQPARRALTLAREFLFAP